MHQTFNVCMYYEVRKRETEVKERLESGEEAESQNEW